MVLTMLQLKDLPTPEVLDQFAERYPDADVTAVAGFLQLLSVATDLSVALDICLTKHGLLQGRWWVNKQKFPHHQVWRINLAFHVPL